MTAETEGAGKGIDVHKAMAWLFAALTRVPPDPPPGPASSDPGFFNGGSENMKGLYAVCWYVYAFLGNLRSSAGLAGTGQSGGGVIAAARQRLLAFLRRLPHCMGEPTTSTHGQLWCAIVSMALWAAQRVGDEELLAAAVAHKAADYALWGPCRVEGMVLDVWMPGARALQDGKLLGSNSARNAESEIVRAYDPGSGSWLKGRSHVGRNQYNVGPLALLACCPGEIMGRIQQRPDPMPRLILPLHIRRWANGDFIAWYGRLDDAAGEEKQLPKAGAGDAPAHAAGVLDGLKWIEGPGGLEVLAKHLDRYPSTKPALVLDVEGV